MKYVTLFIGLMGVIWVGVCGSLEGVPVKSDAPEKLLQNVRTTLKNSWKKIDYRVCVVEQPPFSVKNKEKKQWEGIAVDIWQGLARENSLRYTYAEAASLEKAHEDLKTGKCDLLIGDFPALPNVDAQSEYTLPFYVSGLGVAFAPKQEKRILDFLEMFISWEFISALGSLILFVLSGSVGMWLLERKKNPYFGKKGISKALDNGMYWSAGTLTSSGSGSVLPCTTKGRAFSIFWMFLGVLLSSVLVAAVASSLTVGRLSSLFADPKHLKKIDVGCVQGSDGEFFLSQSLIACIPQGSLEEALEALMRGDIQALVYSDPLLRYEVGRKKLPLDLYSTNYSQLYYSFVVNGNQLLLHELNKAILLYVNGPAWKKNIFKYLKSSKHSILKGIDDLL